MMREGAPLERVARGQEVAAAGLLSRYSPIHTVRLRLEELDSLANH
jgi:hypothetical protein